MANIAVSLREYKLMLNTDRFQDRVDGAENFFNLIRLLIKKEDGTIVEIQNKEEQRITYYLDTPECDVRQNDFALRLREETTNIFQLNLKCGSSDRFLSANTNIFSEKGKKAKFEEEVLPFNSKFCRSNIVEFQSIPQISTIKELIDLFPGTRRLTITKRRKLKRQKTSKL